MVNEAEEEYHVDPSVPEVNYNNILPVARRPHSPPLSTDEVDDKHAMLEFVFGHHPDGFASVLSGLRLQLGDFLASRSARAPASDPNLL